MVGLPAPLQEDEISPGVLPRRCCAAVDNVQVVQTTPGHRLSVHSLRPKEDADGRALKDSVDDTVASDEERAGDGRLLRKHVLHNGGTLKRCIQGSDGPIGAMRFLCTRRARQRREGIATKGDNVGDPAMAAAAGDTAAMSTSTQGNDAQSCFIQREAQFEQGGWYKEPDRLLCSHTPSRERVTRAAQQLLGHSKQSGWTLIQQIFSHFLTWDFKWWKEGDARPNP